MFSCEITWEKNNFLEDEMKVQKEIPILLVAWPDSGSGYIPIWTAIYTYPMFGI